MLVNIDGVLEEVDTKKPRRHFKKLVELKAELIAWFDHLDHPDDDEFTDSELGTALAFLIDAIDHED